MKKSDCTIGTRVEITHPTHMWYGKKGSIKVPTEEGCCLVSLDNDFITRVHPLHMKMEVIPPKSRMRTVRVSFRNGYSFITSITGTIDEIVDYYTNNKFNIASFPYENMQSASIIEFIDKED